MWRDRDVVRSVAAIIGIHDPFGACLDGSVHVKEEARIGAAAKLGRANRARVVRGLNFEKRGSAWLRFLFRANAFPGQNTEHARLEEVDAEWFGFIKGERTRRP